MTGGNCRSRYWEAGLLAGGGGGGWEGEGGVSRPTAPGPLMCLPLVVVGTKNGRCL